MPTIRFNQVFAALLGISFLSAFVLPERTNVLRGALQGLFAPVSRPVYWLAGTVHTDVTGGPAAEHPDKRSLAEVRQENDELKVQLANVEQQLAALKQLNADRDRVGSVRSLCIAVPVTGADTGNRESLSIGRTPDISAGMPVLYANGLAGRIDRAGATGAQVRLLTDPDFTLLADFARPLHSGDHVVFAKVPLQTQLVRGIGHGEMQIRTVPLKTVQESGLAVGDWVVLADTEWPAALQGYRIGTVASIDKLSNAPLYADIRIKPYENLMELKEVQVMRSGAGAIQ